MKGSSGSSSPNHKENVRRKSYIPGPMFGPFSFINVSSGEEVLDAGNGMKNMVEVAVTLRIIRLLYKACSSSKHKISIAVLSPYPAQVACIQQKLKIQYQNNDCFEVNVGLVQNYRGGEVDVTIISTVGFHGDQLIEFNRSPHKARHCLWILGDERALLKEESIWKSLILEARDHQCFFHAHEHNELAKVVVEVKKDLLQLDDLVRGENTLFQSTPWKVFLSGKFRKSFSKIESLEIKKLVLLMLLKLSSGWRPKHSSTAASINENYYSELIKEFKVRRLHLICTIDIVKETQYTQVLKVWDILPFHEIAELAKRLEGIIGMYTQEYIDRCKTKCVQRGFEFPMNWPMTPNIIQYRSQSNSKYEVMFIDGADGDCYVENAKVGESLQLMKFYSLSSGAVNNMISGCDGGDIAVPFELTEQEKEVVSFDKSSFILGRSGTGKTTVLTMKLFRNEQLHHVALEGFHEVREINEEVKQDVLRQIFVTLSPKLCYAVKQHIGELKRLTRGGSSSNQSSSLNIDDIDKMMLFEDIPDTFIHIPQDAYPLIITFHRYLLMLDGTVGTSYFERFPGARHLIYGNKTSASRLVALERYMRFSDVTYDRFSSIYWPHFNAKLTKNLDCSIVYTEIMSVIKGGLTAGQASKGFLSKDDYVSLCDDRTSILDAQKRETVYAIFLKYEKKKVENGNFDLTDLVNDLLCRLEFEGYKGDSIDYVYIDEVQDLSMRQIELFKYVCTNVYEGFSFSGDTAQAIAKGTGFRFEDIRCLFFNKFLVDSQKGQMSEIFQLSENFRTHAGVLNLAQSVINLLYRFFPLFVDVLSPETSRVSGELPSLLETDINDNVIQNIFGRNEGYCQQIIGFGANQVILVRDEYIKKEIVDIVGKNALVLTIMESKGLEFQDVLLYNFFTTSSFTYEWRIIYDYMMEKEQLSSPSTAPCSSFKLEKHIVLCSELKQLYVAITRTRQRLWISETTGFSKPIFEYWKKLSLVQVKHLSDSFVEEMQIPSSREEWKSRGFKLFYENNFWMARMCFLKVGDKYSERLAEAYQLRSTANCTPASQLKRKKLLEDAAKLFSTIGKNELAAECFYEIKDYKTAGDMYLSESMLEQAGNCYHLAKSYELAVEVYDKAGAFAKCLSACADGKLFETGFQLIGRWGGCDGVELKFFEKGARHFFVVKDMKSMIKFVRSFRSKDVMRNFLTKRRCYDELILLEKEWGNYKEAANVARLKPDPVLEADLLQMAGLHRESSLIILWHVFLNSSIFQTTDDPFTQKGVLLKKAASIAKSDSDYFYKFVSEAAEILSDGETQEQLLKKGLEFIYRYKENAAVVGLERVKTTREIEKIEKDVVNLLRSFFKSVNRLDELLLLEEVRGEFVEAAKVAEEVDHAKEAALIRLWYVNLLSSFFKSVNRLDELLLLEEERGEFVQAAKFAEEVDHAKEAALIRLWYVFFGSLWACGKLAWPLKPFKQKGKLLADAKLYAECHTVSLDSGLLHTEIDVLSSAEMSLSQMWSYLSKIPLEGSLRMHFVISRRILDVHLHSCCTVYVCNEIWVEGGEMEHLEGMLSENIVSVNGLIYFWSYWRDLIWELVNWSYKRGHSGNDDKICEDFIFNYFGVRKYDRCNNGCYVMLDAEAHWAKKINPFLEGYLYIIDAHKFSSVASGYWCKELLLVAQKLLRKLQTLHAYSIVENFSMHQQTRILMSMFEVAKSLQKYRFPDSRDHASRIVKQFFQPCVDQFSSNVFHINWQQVQSKEMIYLRENETFMNMLKEAIDTNSKSQKGLTNGQLGRTAMMLLGTKMNGFNHNTMGKLRDSSQNWKDCFDKLSRKNGDLAISLYNVLAETCSAGWRRFDDRISPACFLYLIERLLILASCCRGYVFTTRFSCVEWLVYEEWGVHMGKNGASVTSLDAMKNIHCSLASMVSKLLSFEDDLKEWIARSKEDSPYDILVLRLIIVLVLICANSGRHHGHLFDLLGRKHIVRILPFSFREALIKDRKESCFVEAVGVACRERDNPLVIVSFTKDLSESPCTDAIFLNMSKHAFSREMLIEVLYAEKRKDAASCSHDRESSKES